jgi:hypothetical protein
LFDGNQGTVLQTESLVHFAVRPLPNQMPSSPSTHVFLNGLRGSSSIALHAFSSGGGTGLFIAGRTMTAVTFFLVLLVVFGTATTTAATTVFLDGSQSILFSQSIDYIDDFFQMNAFDTNMVDHIRTAISKNQSIKQKNKKTK